MLSVAAAVFTTDFFVEKKAGIARQATRKLEKW